MPSNNRRNKKEKRKYGKNKTKKLQFKCKSCKVEYRTQGELIQHVFYQHHFQPEVLLERIEPDQSESTAFQTTSSTVPKGNKRGRKRKVDQNKEESIKEKRQKKEKLSTADLKVALVKNTNNKSIPKIKIKLLNNVDPVDLKSLSSKTTKSESFQVDGQIKQQVINNKTSGPQAINQEERENQQLVTLEKINKVPTPFKLKSKVEESSQTDFNAPNSIRTTDSLEVQNQIGIKRQNKIAPISSVQNLTQFVNKQKISVQKSINSYFTPEPINNTNQFQHSSQKFEKSSKEYQYLANQKPQSEKVTHLEQKQTICQPSTNVTPIDYNDEVNKLISEAYQAFNTAPNSSRSSNDESNDIIKEMHGLYYDEMTYPHFVNSSEVPQKVAQMSSTLNSYNSLMTPPNDLNLSSLLSSMAPSTLTDYNTIPKSDLSTSYMMDSSKGMNMNKMSQPTESYNLDSLLSKNLNTSNSSCMMSELSHKSSYPLDSSASYNIANNNQYNMASGLTTSYNSAFSSVMASSNSAFSSLSNNNSAFTVPSTANVNTKYVPNSYMSPNNNIGLTSVNHLSPSSKVASQSPHHVMSPSSKVASQSPHHVMSPSSKVASQSPHHVMSPSSKVASQSPHHEMSPLYKVAPPSPLHNLDSSKVPSSLSHMSSSPHLMSPGGKVTSSHHNNGGFVNIMSNTHSSSNDSVPKSADDVKKEGGRLNLIPTEKLMESKTNSLCNNFGVSSMQANISSMPSNISSMQPYYSMMNNVPSYGYNMSPYDYPYVNQHSSQQLMTTTSQNPYYNYASSQSELHSSSQQTRPPVVSQVSPQSRIDEPFKKPGEPPNKQPKIVPKKLSSLLSTPDEKKKAAAATAMNRQMPPLTSVYSVQRPPPSSMGVRQPMLNKTPNSMVSIRGLPPTSSKQPIPTGRLPNITSPLRPQLKGTTIVSSPSKSTSSVCSDEVTILSSSPVKPAVSDGPPASLLKKRGITISSVPKPATRKLTSSVNITPVVKNVSKPPERIGQVEITPMINTSRSSGAELVKESESNLGIPVINLNNKALLNNLSQMGICNFIPVSQMKNSNQVFGLPIVSTNQPNVKLNDLGACGLLNLGSIYKLK